MRIASGVTDQYIYFVAVDATNFTSRETGLSTWTVYRSRNGGTAAAMTTPTINETDVTNMPGVYELLLDEDMTIDAGDETQEMVFHITHSGMAPVTRTIELYRPKITAGNTLGVASDGDVSGNVDGNVVGSVGSLATQAKADVNAEVVDTLATDTYAEPAQGAPGATVSLKDKIGYLYKAWRNKSDQNATTYQLYNDDASTVDHKATVSDDGTTATKGEVATGP